MVRLTKTILPANYSISLTKIKAVITILLHLNVSMIFFISITITKRYLRWSSVIVRRDRHVVDCISGCSDSDLGKCSQGFNEE